MRIRPSSRRGSNSAWAVKRGASETETLVIVRVDRGASHRFIRLDGVDPFTKDHKVFVAARPLDRETDLAIPRAQLRRSPEHRVSFLRERRRRRRQQAETTVFYLGVPDTTPEFAERARRTPTSSACWVHPSGLPPARFRAVARLRQRDRAGRKRGFARGCCGWQRARLRHGNRVRVGGCLLCAGQHA